MYPRNRKKRTFFSPGTEDRVKKRREGSPDDFEERIDSDKVARLAPLTTTKGGSSSSSSEKKSTHNKLPDDRANKRRREGEREKRDRGSDDEDHRALKRKSSKKALKQEDDDGKSDDLEGDGFGYEWGSDMEEGHEGNESGNESGDDSPANEYHLARESFNSEESSLYGEGADADVEESEASKLSASTDSANGVTNDNNGVASETLPSTSTSTPASPSTSTPASPPTSTSTSTTSTSSDSLAKAGVENDSTTSTNTTNSPPLNPTNASTLPRERSTNGLQTSEKYKKKDAPPLTKITIAKPKTKPPTTVLSPDSLTPEYFKTLLDEMKTEISRLTYRLEITTNANNTRLQEYEEKYVSRAVYTVLEDEVTYLKQQLQSHSSSQTDSHSTTGLEKIKHDMVFVRGNLEEVNNDVRQWRMAMDVDLTDKEDRLTQLSLRLDDIERNQQALIIRYPQLMQPAASVSTTPSHSPSPVPERLSSSTSSNWSGSSSSEKVVSGNSSKPSPVNSMQKEREKHSQGSHSQRMMLPPDVPPKYPPTTAPSSPQSQASSASFLTSSFEPSTPSFIQPEPGWSQSPSPMYSRQFASPSGPTSGYYASPGGYSKATASKGHHHLSVGGPAGPGGHDRHSTGPGPGPGPGDRGDGRMQQQQQYERSGGQHDRLAEKTNRPWL